jgi:acetyl esterase/lipase
MVPMPGERIDIRQSLALGSAGAAPLCGDLYLPAQTGEEKRPAVVLIFGGGWNSGERAQQKVYGLALARAGFVCLATDYRFSSEAKWPAQLDDISTAIRWLRANAGEYRIDSGRIAVSGNSSGGHLALMAAAASDGSVPGLQTPAEHPAHSSGVSAVCAFYPPTQLRELDLPGGDDTVRSLLGAGASPSEFDRASPLAYASRPLPPVLLISGSDDGRVPVGQTRRMHDALLEAGNTVELHLFAGQGHAIDADPGFARLTAAILVGFFQRYV